MNNENSGEVEIRRENALSDSSDTAVDNDVSEDVKPPDSKRFQLEMDEMVRRIRESEAKIKSLEKQVSGFGGKIQAAMSVDTDKLQSELQELRTLREKVIEERKQFDLELKGLNIQVQKKNDACTKLQAGVRYKSEARIDEAVRRLEHQMQAQQLKLSEEKRIVAEIDTLKRSKRNLHEYLDLKQYVDQLRYKQKHLRSQRDACVKRINGLKSREEEIKNLLDSDASDENDETKRQQLELLNELELYKTELDELHTKKRELKANFTKERNDYYAAIREIKTQKQKEESTRRKPERIATLSKPVASSRTKEQPHEKEKALCDTLINHLERLHINTIHLPDVQSATQPDKEPVISLAASADFSLSGDKGVFLRRKSATDDLIGVYAGVARTSRRGSRKGRRSSAKEVPRKLNLHPQVVEHLLTLGLSPPSTAADIPKVLEELQEKKDFYESALTSSHVLAPVSNDAMSPITEEAAPEFPSKFQESRESETPEAAIQFPSTLEESSVSNTPEAAVQDETTTSVEDNTADANIQSNSPVTPERIRLNSTEEDEASLSENTDKANIELTDNSNGFLSEKESDVSKLKMIELDDAASGESSVLCNPEPAVFSGNSEASLDEPISYSPAHTAIQPNSEVLFAVNEDSHGSDDKLLNCIENEKSNHVREDKLEYSGNSQIHSTKIGSAPKEDNLIPHSQSNTICTEHSSFTGSSIRSTNLLMEENGLEVAYDRNSLNESGGIGKIQCEKCPA